MRTNWFICLVSAFMLTSSSSCIKKLNDLLEDKADCDKINEARITGAKSLYRVGEPLQLSSSTSIDGALCEWRRSGDLNVISNSKDISIDNCTKYHEGWFWLNVGHTECSYHVDSVYIKVINKEATPPCSPVNNTVAFSSIPDITASSVRWRLDQTWNCRVLEAYAAFGYPELKIYFHPYWNTREPEDGPYNMASTLTFNDNDLYTVFVTSLYSSIYFQPKPGKVYVSHVNGKIQATFCDLSLSGSQGGPSYTVTASGKITAP